MQNLDFGFFLAIAAGIASFLTAISSTAYVLHFITPNWPPSRTCRGPWSAWPSPSAEVW